jgi:uncharacterized membrane protein YwaF
MQKSLRHWLPLVIGPLCILALSFALTWAEGERFGWRRDVRVRMSVLTAAGPLGGILSDGSLDAWFWSCFWAAPLVYAMLAYSLRPCKSTAWVTVIGFVLWQFLGFAFARAGV